TTVKKNHRAMVHRAHILDEDWLTLSDIPQQWTYGEHVYNKGADVAHALRGYLGDALFVQGFTSFLETYAFQSVNTSLLRDHLTQETGMDMTDFFNDYIDQPGWAAFEVDSFRVEQVVGGVWPTNVFVEQKQRGPSSPYNNVPITVTCYDVNGAGWDSPQQLFGGTNSSAIVLPPFEPVAVVLNADELISLAITLDADTMESPGILNSVNSDLRVTVANMPTPTPIVVQEYWVAADPEVDETFAFVVSPDRYWRVTAQLPVGAELTGRINYDGRDIISGALDIGLMNDYNGVAFTEDSLVVLYRPSARVAWTLHPDQTLNTIGSATNKTGRIDINDLQAGEYTLAWRKSAVSVSENAREAVWSIFPNPATNRVLVRTDMNSPNGVIELLDQRGALIRQLTISENVLVFPLEGVSAGTYMLRFASKGTRTNVGPLVITE
ncbi:MAG TPA: M1 family aminopeptidase, partial [Flavobacteriales bacterium]|nr:M1 family aminopeptidase [Flavobacteriales bacterium]